MFVKNTLLLLFFVGLNLFAFSQNTCPDVDKVNNGNGKSGVAPGDFRPNYNQNNPVASCFVGTKYQMMTVDPATKSGEITLKWDNLDVNNIPAITNVWFTNSSGVVTKSTNVFGPAAPVKSGEDKVVFCFYGPNLPNSGKISLEFTNAKTGVPQYFCTYDLKKFESATNPVITQAYPTILTQPQSQNVLGDGSVAFSVDFKDAYNFTWQYSTDGNTWNTISNSDFVSNNNQLTVSNRIKYDKYFFRVVLNNIYGTITSNPAKLTVDYNPSVAFDGANKSCDAGSLQGVNVKLTGISPWTITYKINEDLPVTISGINTNSYSIPVQLDTDFTLTLLSVNDSKYSNNSIQNNVFYGFKKLSVNQNDITITEHDSIISINPNYVGTIKQFTLSKTNLELAGINNVTRLVNDTVFKVSNLTLGEYIYSIKAINSEIGCESEIKTFKINVTPNPVSILVQPIDTADFLLDGIAKINASALFATSFYWEKSIDNGITWGKLFTGGDYFAYKDSLVINNRLSHNKEMFRVNYSNNVSSVTSNVSLLFIEQLPVAYFKNTVNCDVDILIAVPVLFEGTPPFELIYQVEGVPGEEAHFVPNIKTNIYNIIVGGLTKQTNIKLLKVNNRRYANTNLTKDALFTSYKKNTLTSFVDTLEDGAQNLVFKTTGNAYKTFDVVNGTTTFPNFEGANGVIKDSTISFALPNNLTTTGRFNFVVTMRNENLTCYNTAKVYISTIQNKLQITKQPTNQTYVENGTAVFSLNSENATSFKWQYTFNDGATWNEIQQGGNFVKVTKDSLVFNNRLFYKNNKFRIVLYGKFDNVTSNIVTLNVDRKPIAFFESNKKCYNSNAKSTLIYFKGTAPYKFSYSDQKGIVKTITNVTKDVYTLSVDNTVTKLRLLSVSDAKFTEVLLDSSNTVELFEKPVYRPYFKSSCFGDTMVELLFSGTSKPKTFNVKVGKNPIPGFAEKKDVNFSNSYLLALPKNLKVGTYGFVINGTDGTCISDDSNLDLPYNSKPVMHASSNKIYITQGDSVKLTSTGADVVRWTPTAGIDSVNSKITYAKPQVTTLYYVYGYTNGCAGYDTVKITVNTTTPTVVQCNPVNINFYMDSVKKSLCTSATGEATFTISGGYVNNTYRVRKKNDNGTYSIITNPAFAPLNNKNGEEITVKLKDLEGGTYDLFAFCGGDSRITSVYNFLIPSDCDSLNVVDTTNTTTTQTNYTCEDMQLVLNNEDIKPIPCDYDFGSVAFSIQGGSPNFTYRLRKRNTDNTFSIITNPVFVSIGNKANESKKITIDELAEGEYELYVYCSHDVSYFKTASFYIYRQGCRAALKDVISYYTFDNNDNDSIKRASSPEANGAVKDIDNYGNNLGAYKFYNSTDNIVFKNFVDIDTMKEYSYSFWYKLLDMPKMNNSMLFSIPNGNNLERMQIVADKNGYLKVQFGNTGNSQLINTGYKFEPSTWNQLMISHTVDSNFIYINDKKIGAYASGILSGNNSDFVVGYDGSNNSLRFLFDEFKLYGKAVTNQEVTDIYFADVRENCTGIRLNIDVVDNKLKFVISYGSINNKYRLRKKNSSGVFVSVYDQTFVSTYNKVGENKVINTDNLEPGIYDVYAYCGSDSRKYQGYEFIVDNKGELSIYRKVTPTETIDISNENAAEVKEEIFLNVYPNPVDNIVNIDIIGADTSTEKEIRVISSNGILVHSETFVGSENSSSINVENFRPGVYILEVHLENNRVERKQIIIN